MKVNQRWIRDLFRYSLASISSLSITLYIMFSTIGLFLPKENSETINDIFTKNEISEIDDEWEIIIGYWWDNLKGVKYLYLEENINERKNSISKIALNINKKAADNADQSLQNGIIFYHEENSVENNSEAINWNQFDIEKIISDLHLQKEKRVAVVAKELWIDWKKEKLDYARLAWIDWIYNWSLDQNQKIRNYLIAHAQEIYKDKHWWNEWETLPLVTKEEKKVKMNSKEITWQVTYNDVTLKVSAPAESFPEWTVLKIKTLGDDDSTTTFDITFKEVILMTKVDKVEYDAPMASFDISFYAPDDTEFINELQPAEWKSVSVTFDYTNNKEFKQPEDQWFLAIYHMEDNGETSANLVSIKDEEKSKENNKSDSMSFYANTLSVYILTIVSDLDEEPLEDNETIKLDTGYEWFIVDNDDIILSSSWADIESIYTWKILARDNEITLPKIQLASWHVFSWRYNGKTFLWKAWAKFKLWDIDNSESEKSNSDVEDSKNNYEVYACSYKEWTKSYVCSSNENQISDLDISDNNLDNEIPTNVNVYTPSEEEIEKFGQELFDAYNRAINNWITTIDDIDKAKLDKKITRAELAKMMVEFMSWVLEKERIITDEVSYNDVDSEKLWDLAWYIQLAYQYQIMWIKEDWSPMEKFNPNKTVTRAEFATVLSRVLFGNTYNQSWKNYHEKHIEALEKVNILSNTNPNLVEARWWIMTMLYKSQL